MALRTKTLILIGLTLVILIGALYIALRSILTTGFAALETQEITDELDAVATYLQAEARAFHDHLSDWSNWDDTFAFAQTYDPNYVAENLTSDTFDSLQINVMLFFKRDTALIHAVGFEPDGGWMRITRLAAFYDALLSYRERTPLESFYGMMTLGDEVLMVAGRPIYNNQGFGDSTGTLVWVRILDPVKIGQYSEALAHRFMIATTSAAMLGDADRKAVEQLTAQPYFTDTSSRQVAYGYTLLPEMGGQREVLVRVEIGREVYREGQESILYYLITLLIVGLFLILCVLFIIENFVLIPLWRLSGDVRSIAAIRDFRRRLPVRGSDELTELARGINTMLEAVERSEDALKQLNAELESRVTERTAELAEKNRELAGFQAQKDVFFARASHELRTPLTNIITRVYLLEKQPEQLEAHLRVLRSVSTYMRDLINEILEISRIQRGSITLNQSRLHLQTVLREVLDIQHAEAERHALTLRTDITDEPLYILGDSRRMKQIMTNLITNAINYTAANGEIAVELSVSGDQRAVIRVHDSGIGIPPEHLEHLFEPFYRAREEYGVGTGLGLMIVRELVKLHHGEVSVESVVGVGTTFTVTLPRLSAAPLADAVGAAPVTSA
jgi:signal transduction histidine kinase